MAIAVDKEKKYSLSLSQIKELLRGEESWITNYSNIAAVLKENHRYLWVGFYFVQGEELLLGPFQGPVACTRIRYGKGVCGTSWMRKESIVVPDVHEFPGHIACSALSQSEIVVPVFDKNGVVRAVLDADSEELSHFDDTDKDWLERIADLIRERHG